MQRAWSSHGLATFNIQREAARRYLLSHTILLPNQKLTVADEKTLADYGAPQEENHAGLHIHKYQSPLFSNFNQLLTPVILHLVLGCGGRYIPWEDPKYSQLDINPDYYLGVHWRPVRTAVFNIHLSDSKGACEIFGKFSP
jgi:hypothetical protein